MARVVRMQAISARVRVGRAAIAVDPRIAEQHDRSAALAAATSTSVRNGHESIVRPQGQRTADVTSPRTRAT